MLKRSRGSWVLLRLWSRYCVSATLREFVTAMKLRCIATSCWPVCMWGHTSLELQMAHLAAVLQNWLLDVVLVDCTCHGLH